MRYLKLIAVVATVALFQPCARVAVAEQQGQGNQREVWQRLFKEMQEQGYNFKDIREALGKQRNGEALTEEEKKGVAKFQELRQKYALTRPGQNGQQGRPDGFGGRPASRRGVNFVHVKLNPLDGAYQAMAEVYSRSQKYVEAVNALKFILEHSPDKEARNVAHFNIAQIYRRGLNYQSHAAEEYLKVRGKLRERALRELVQMFVEARDPQLAIDTLTEMANTAEDDAEKLDLLRTLAFAYSRSGKRDEVIAVLKQITEMLTYEEAVQMKDRYTKEDDPGGYMIQMLQGIMRNTSNQGMMRGRGGPGMRPGQPGQGQQKQPRRDQ